MGKHLEPLGMTNPYLVVPSDERLSGSYRGSAVHFQVGVVILPHKHLQDVQHLEKKGDQKQKRQLSEQRKTGREAGERETGAEVWIISKRIRAD